MRGFIALVREYPEITLQELLATESLTFDDDDIELSHTTTAIIIRDLETGGTSKVSHASVKTYLNRARKHLTG